MIFSCFSHTLFHLYLSEVTSQHRIIYLSYPLFCRRDRWKWRLVLTHKTKKKKKKKKQKRPSICCWIIISLCWDKNVSKEKKRFEINDKLCFENKSFQLLQSSSSSSTLYVSFEANVDCSFCLKEEFEELSSKLAFTFLAPIPDFGGSLCVAQNRFQTSRGTTLLMYNILNGQLNTLSRRKKNIC